MNEPIERRTRAPRTAWVGLTLGVLLLPGLCIAQPVRLTIPAFGANAEIEVRDMNIERAREAVQAALAELHAVDRLFDAQGDRTLGGLATLLAAPTGQPATIDARLAALLRRAQHFCRWSSGIFGPLGGRMYRTVEAMRDTSDVQPTDFRDAIASAGCELLSVSGVEGLSDADPIAAIGTAEVIIADGSVPDVRGWALGFAIDRALGVLRERGVTNAWIECGNVRRGIGPGPGGDGWLAVLGFPGLDKPLQSIWLRDRALAVSTPVGGTSQDDLLTLDQRSGQRTDGVVAVVAISELATDAQALAVSLHITGLFQGKMRAGSLQPIPSVLWLLGDGRRMPVVSSFKWADVPKARR